MASTATAPRLGRVRGLLPLFITAALLAIAVGGAGFVINRVDAERRDMQLSRVQVRHTVAADFVAAYVGGLVEHESELAETTLSGPVTVDMFDRVISENGFASALLLDEPGNLLAVSPPALRLLGQPLPSRHSHLVSALNGSWAASNVVVDANVGEATIALAVPFQTTSGLRVFSPAHRISTTPLQAFTDNAMSLASSRALLVDGSGRIITSSDSTIGAGETIDQWSDLATAANATGEYEVEGVDTYAVVGDVPGTPWQLVFTVSTKELLLPVSGPGRLVPWGILAAFTAASVVALVMWRRAQHERSSRLGYERQLHDMAMRDALTGLSNRRVAEDRLQHALKRAQRLQTSVAVLYIDVDKFKGINDLYGHAAGDTVLTTVADRMRTTFRTEDTIARLGGDEFAVICEGLKDPHAVEELVSRTRAALSEPYPFGDMLLSCSASVGHTTAVPGDTPEVLLARADRLMYSAKAHGVEPVATPTAQPLART